jgi:hypothetical protein
VTLPSRRLDESCIQSEADAFAPARTVDAETTRWPPRGQEDGVSETSVVTEFRWIEAGGGLPVLCLHRLFGASDHWKRLVEAVFRCLAMALRLPIFETPYHDGCTDRPPDVCLGSWGVWFGASP